MALEHFDEHFSLFPDISKTKLLIYRENKWTLYKKKKKLLDAYSGPPIETEFYFQLKLVFLYLEKIISGVPQGSSLSRLFFSLNMFPLMSHNGHKIKSLYICEQIAWSYFFERF